MSGNCTISRTVPLAESAKSFLCDYEDNNEDNVLFDFGENFLAHDLQKDLQSHVEAVKVCANTLFRRYRASKPTSKVNYMKVRSIVKDNKIMSGIFSNLKYVWYASGRRVQVIESRTGRKVASWTFGALSKDNTTKIICLSEIPCLSKEIPLLIIGLECALTGGTICIFDILTSKILRSIQMNDIVSCIHIIDCGSNIFPILGPLNAFDGVVAVGSVGGDVLLVDLCQQYIDDARASNAAEDIIGEIDVCQINPLTIKDIHAIEDHKQKAIQSGSHLSIILNAVLNAKSPHFILKGPKGGDRIHVNKVEVLVTSLFYSPQLGSLLVGYNFGAWQIWNIVNMTLVYTSPVYEENIPVSHFTMQEPADDPRAFCYVWAIYSNTDDRAGFPIAVMYSLNYEVKDFHEGYGYLYQDLQSCAVRFQTELAAVGGASVDIKGARCLRLTAFNKGCSSRTSMQESHEDTFTICSMVWNAWGTKGVDTYMSIFDLNQWYKEQMPSSPQQNCSTYLSYICVSDIVNEVDNNSTVLDVLIDESSINQFIGIQKPEEHYYPSALAYELCACSDKNIANIYNKGQQRTLLGQFDSTGPLILLKPKEVFEQSIKSGLTPLFADPVHSDLNLQREFLLNIALEQDMIGFLWKCVCTWSNGSFTGMGCSIEFLLNWAWKRATLLKINADKLCETLFDYSEISLDANNRKILNSCTTQISSLHRLYGLMRKKLQLSLSNIDIVQQQENCLHMIVTYLEVLQWLINIGLLPEFAESSTQKALNRSDGTYAPYPIESLLKYYKERRSTVSKETSLLYIDTLIEKEFGNRLQGLWQDDGGDGYYPPPSLQSLLRIYLIENADMVHKHCIVIYLFLDLAMALDQMRFKFIITHLIKFPMVFRISSSMTKIIQALWQLDHGDFPTAMDQLLDPHISTSDLELWHHRIVLNALLLQRQHNFALLYFQVRKPPLEDVQDILNILSLYIENHMVDEAVNFCREHSSVENDTRLFRHVFQECTRTNQILEFVYYPLNLKEEEILMKYLGEISYDRIEEFRVNFYLHRSRYIDIFQIKKKEDKSFPSGLQGQKKMGSCDNAMKVITNLFPKVTKDIFNICQHETTTTQNEVLRPKPMSVFVHNADEKAKYKSTLIRAGILKSKEIWSHPVPNKSISESFPFIKTPTTSSELRKRGSIICPKFINASLIKNDEDVSPKKRMKFSVEPSLIDSTQQAQDGNETNTSCFLDMSKLLRSTVKRKIHWKSDSNKVPNEEVDICTPQSILKVKNMVTPQSFKNSPIRSSSVASKNLVVNLASPITRAMDLTPRKSLSRSVVRFENLQESSSTESPELSRTTEPIEMTDISNVSKSSEVNENSSQSEDTFYSPNTSGYDNEDKESTDHLMKDVKISPSTEIPPVQTECATKVTVSQEQIKRISPKGRSSYRSSSPRVGIITTESVQISKNKTKDFVVDEPEATPRKSTRAARSKLQESTIKSTALLSPRNITLKISRRHSLNKLVLEDTGTSVVSSQHFIPSESTAQLGEQSPIGNISSSSSLASEEFDRMVKDQSFSIPHMSLSPVQCSASTVLDISDVSGKVNESALDLVNVVVANETDAKHENEQYRRSYMKVKGRKSLSRMVMERNISSMYTSTPHHSFIEEDTNKSFRNSNKAGVGELSKLSATEQLELDRVIKNQFFDIPDISLSLDQYSEDSNITPENNSIDTCATQSIKETHIESDSNLNRMEMEVHVLPPHDSTSTVSNKLKENEPLQNKESEKLQTNIKLDEINFIAQESLVEVGEITGKDRDFESNGSNQDQDNFPLQQNFPHLNDEDNEDKNKEVVELAEDNTSEGIVHEGNIPETNLPEMENYANNELTRNSDDFNTTQCANNEIIEIPDTGSSCGSESNIKSMNSNKYSDVGQEGNEESIEFTIDTNSGILELDKNISAEFEDTEMEVLEIHTNTGFESPQSYEALVSDLLVEAQEHVEDEDKRRTISSVEEAIVEERHQNNENQVEFDGNEVTTSSQRPCKEFENINTASPAAGPVEVRPDMSLDQSMEIDRDDKDELQDTQKHHSPQNDDNPEFKTEISMDENSKANTSDYCNTNESDMTSSQMHFLENRSIEASTVEDISITDILDTVDMEKTTYVNISVTDILEKSLIDRFNDAKEEGIKQDLLTKEVSDVDHTTSGKKLDPSNMLEGKDNIAESTQVHHKMQLRKRTLSNTSIERPSNRTLRKRSVSTDEVTARRSKLMASPSEPKDQGNTSNSQCDLVQSNPRILRNRRAVSISHISDIETENTLSPRRKNIRTVPVSDLPIISEEATAVNKGTSNKNENIKDEKQLQDDDLEIYSTSRRLTRHQKSLLERSKGKHSLAKICEDDVTQTEEMIDDNADKHITPVAEGKARIITRRISQESTSSIVSTGNSASDVSPNKKRKTPQKPETDSPQRQALRRGRSKSIDEVSVTSQVSKSSRTTRKSEVSDSDDQSTVSLRRSTRNRSKTPDIEGSSKMSSRNKKTLSKIPEEDDEVC